VRRRGGTALLLAFDDTDSRAGGCTTYLAFHVLLALPELALGGLPRLVRLNPNVPWKTRGNGAVCLPLVHPTGPSVRVGELRGHEVLAFPDGAAAEPTPELLQRVWDVVRAQAQADAQPAVALASDPLPAAAYLQAVQTRVDADAARALLDSMGVLHREAGTHRALAGCLGALAWPGPATSHEFLAYREPQRWGTPRSVRREPLASLDATGATFHTTDPRTGDLLCVPHGSDPVLIGLRGRDPEALLHAATRTLPFALGEPVDGWLLWDTNQGSGDHVTPVGTLEAAPEWGTVELAAKVAERPVGHASHAFVALEDQRGVRFTAAAFAQTGALRDAVRGLWPGDETVVVGAMGEPAAGTEVPGPTVNLEKLQVVRLAPRLGPPHNPPCPSCGRRMKSAGAGQGLRCRSCGTKAPDDARVRDASPPDVTVGWHEAAASGRRHLHRPLAWGAP